MLISILHSGEWENQSGRQICVLLFLVATFTSTVAAAGQQIRKYEILVTDEFTYAADCATCPLVYGSRARVIGAFEVSLDFDGKTGILQSLDANLIDVETLIGLPPIWTPQPNIPFFPDLPVLDPYRPPLPGILNTIGETVVLSTNGPQTSSSTTFPLPDIFHLTMSDEDAVFDFVIPMIDVMPRIINAKATLIYISPEPSTFVLLLLGLAMLFQFDRSRRR